MIGADELRDDLGVALRLAELAAGAILPHYQRCASERKPDGSEVTAADLAAERAIRDRLARERPDDGVLGEEFGEQAPRAGGTRRWVVDPLDGTAYFALGLPSFSTLIALVDGDEPVLGVIHLPVTAETVYAARGLGCWWRRKPDAEPERLHVAGVSALADAFASVSHPMSSDLLPTAGQPSYRLSRLIRSVREIRFAGDAIKHTLLCRGRLHAAVDTVMFPWDIAAIVPCVEEAGGVVTGLTGDRARVLHGGTLLSTGHPSLHRAILEVLTPEEAAAPR